MSDIEVLWKTSEFYRDARVAYENRVYGTRNCEPFELSQEFRNARHAFRKTVNGSWGKEST